MRILLLPNSLKGSLSARQTARILQRTLHKHKIKSFPLSDGGDGFIDFFTALYPHATLVSCTAQNAFGISKRTSYLWLSKQKTAVIETARVCGLGTAKKEELDPLGASSFGVGQVILHALNKGAKTIYIGLGGVACSDGGAGMAAALGTRFLDARGKRLPLGTKPLLKLAALDIKTLSARLRGVTVYAVADVINPMLGPRGSARIFGPQKGATPSQVHQIEKALAQYARVVQKTTGKNIAHTPSTAAAGALCAGLYGLCGADIILGADFLRAHLPLEKWGKWADLIITSEGKLDTQTLFGKAPLAALQTAATYRKPALFICGQYDPRATKKLPKNLQLSIACLADFAPSAQESIDRAAYYLGRLGKILNEWY